MDSTNPKWDARPAPGEPSPHEYLDRHMAAVGSALSGPGSTPATPAPSTPLTGAGQVALQRAIKALGGTAVSLDPGMTYSAAIRARFPNLPATHQGMDIQIGGKGGGDNVLNPFAGAKVIAARTGTNDGYGNMVDLDLGGGVTTRMAHFQDLNVKAGQVLKAGQVIGQEGHTGNAEGDHLHIEFRQGGKAITDPTEWMKEFLRQQMLHNGTSSAGGSGQPTVLVKFEGLDKIHVTGATGAAAAQIQAGARQIAAGVGASFVPPSHRGA